MMPPKQMWELCCIGRRCEMCLTIWQHCEIYAIISMLVYTWFKWTLIHSEGKRKKDSKEKKLQTKFKVTYSSMEEIPPPFGHIFN